MPMLQLLKYSHILTWLFMSARPEGSDTYTTEYTVHAYFMTACVIGCMVHSWKDIYSHKDHAKFNCAWDRDN